MTRYKVGDKVKIIHILNGARASTLGEIGEIISVLPKEGFDDASYGVLFDNFEGETWYYTNEELSYPIEVPVFSSPEQALEWFDSE